MKKNPLPVASSARHTLAVSLILLGTAFVQATPIQLTFDAQNDEDPRWNPVTNVIAYQKYDGSFFQIGSVKSDGTGNGFLAQGVNLSLNSCAVSWLNSTTVTFAEAVNFFEDMTFNISGGPQTKTVADGNQGNFVVQMTVPGGSNDGAYVASRDGSTVLWRDALNAGGTNSTTIRTISFSSLNGSQSSSSTGTVALTASNTVVGARGVAMTPNGQKFVIALPSGTGFDLWLYNSNGIGAPIQLTATGAANGDFNGSPDISPDGTTIIFQHNSDIDTIPIGGGAPTALTNTPTIVKGAPTWAPDGVQYAFEEQDSNHIFQVFRDSTVVAPEPTSAGLVLVGGLALLARRRRA